MDRFVDDGDGGEIAIIYQIYVITYFEIRLINFNYSARCIKKGRDSIFLVYFIKT